MENKKVEINLGLVCNNQCKFCMNDAPLKERKFPSFKILEKELKDYYKKGYRAVGFLGGEPTIYPKIIELVSLADRLGYKEIHIVSNGRKYSDKKFLEKLIKSGVTRFSVSIHSHKAEIEDFLTSVKGGFREKIQGLRNLKYFQSKGMIKDKIFLNTVVNKLNYRYLEEIILFYEKMGFLDFRFNFVRPEGRAFSNTKTIVPEYSKIMENVKKAIELAKGLKIQLSFEGIPFCLFSKIKINNFKDYIGEFKDAEVEASFEEKNKRDRFSVAQRRKDQLRIKKISCRDCIFNLVCEGPWRNYAKIYGFKEFKPVKL